MSFPSIVKQGLLCTGGIIGAFLLSFGTDADGVSIGGIITTGAVANGGETTEGVTFNFILVCLSSGTEGVGYRWDFLL